MKKEQIEIHEKLKSKLKSIMMKHVGKSRKIGMGELYYQVFARPWDNRINDTKPIRNLVDELREEGQPICSSTSSTNGGYWLASVDTELDEFIEQASKGLRKKFHKFSVMKNVALPVLMGQLSLKWEAEKDKMING